MLLIGDSFTPFLCGPHPLRSRRSSVNCPKLQTSRGAACKPRACTRAALNMLGNSQKIKSNARRASLRIPAPASRAPAF
jgi:hypothetical protein